MFGRGNVCASLRFFPVAPRVLSLLIHRVGAVERCSGRDDISGEVVPIASASRNWLGKAGFLEGDSTGWEFFSIAGDVRPPSSSSSGHTGYLLTSVDEGVARAVTCADGRAEESEQRPSEENCVPHRLAVFASGDRSDCRPNGKADPSSDKQMTGIAVGPWYWIAAPVVSTLGAVSAFPCRAAAVEPELCHLLWQTHRQSSPGTWCVLQQSR